MFLRRRLVVALRGTLHSALVAPMQRRPMATTLREIKRADVHPVIAHLGITGATFEECMWLGGLDAEKQARVSANVTALQTYGCTTDTLLKLLTRRRTGVMLANCPTGKIESAVDALRREARMSDAQIKGAINHEGGRPFIALARKKRSDVQVRQVFRVLNSNVKMPREQFCSIAAQSPQLLAAPPDALIDTTRELVRVFSPIDNGKHEILLQAIKSHSSILRVSDETIQHKTYTLVQVLDLTKKEVAQLLSRFAHVLRIGSDTICDNVALYEKHLSKTGARQAVLNQPKLLCRRTDHIARRFEICQKIGIDKLALVQNPPLIEANEDTLRRSHQWCLDNLGPNTFSVKLLIVRPETLQHRFDVLLSRFSRKDAQRLMLWCHPASFYQTLFLLVEHLRLNLPPKMLLRLACSTGASWSTQSVLVREFSNWLKAQSEGESDGSGDDALKDSDSSPSLSELPAEYIERVWPLLNDVGIYEGEYSQQRSEVPTRAYRTFS